VRLKTMNEVKSPFEALSRAMSADASAVRVMADLGQTFSDPRVQGVMSQVNAARLGPQGADLLAPLPSWR
jgi:hypothetical protein